MPNATYRALFMNGGGLDAESLCENALRRCSGYEFSLSDRSAIRLWGTALRPGVIFNYVGVAGKR